MRKPNEIVTDLDEAKRIVRALRDAREQAEGELSLRTCWECNLAHERLKDASGYFYCPGCGRRFTGGRFVD